MLVEVLEAGAVMACPKEGAGAGAGMSEIRRLMGRWRGRLRCSPSSLVHNEALLSLRLSLVSQLLQSRRALPGEALGLMAQVRS